MFTRGEFTTGDVTYGVMMSHSKVATEAILITSGTVVSAYKTDVTGSYSYNNNKAKELVQLIQNGVKGCTSKNATPAPFELGAMTQHEFIKTKVEYIMQLHKGEVVGAYIQSDSKRVELSYVKSLQIPTNIPYIKLMEISKNDLEIAENDLDSVPVRSVEEIALEKEDLTWLQNKKYYIVNDDETAEKIFQFLDNYNGVIAYDTETTGLRINCFGKINSEYQKTLIKYNEEHPDEQIRADKLVGIIFCVENDVSYYFPCFNRKFKNLYEDLSSPIRQKIISNVKARYTVGDLRDTDSEMKEYIINTPAEEISCDVILMERVRDILSTKHIVAHNGTFEWKVGWQYEIDTNLKDDTMIMHQLMYKFRSTTRNSGEPSNLKYLAKRELGVDQWELTDFFPDLKEDKTGTVRTKAGARGKKSGIKIDFSYMDYEGTRVYAPTDGDVTFQLFNLYKADMMKNHKEMEYIYSVEVIVSCAVAYMEFYGHKLDESKILGARESTRADIAEIVSEIRQSIDYSNEAELTAYAELKELRTKIESEQDKSVKKQLTESLPSFVDNLNKAIDENTDKVINLASPAQVADLFYNKLGYPMQGDKMSVAKKEIKGLLKEKNEDGTPKCPVAALYSKYKNADTLMTKFFDNLPYFMYPGGYIFSSFGQISTATGRMSCSKPNAQQYPKVITKIVSPRPGYVMMDADYSQIEYRVLTALAKNDWLAELFSNPDSDYHTLMASLMYGVDYAAVTPSMRSAAKSFNFGIPYGMGLGSLAILLTGKNTAQTRDEAAEKMEDYFKNQPRTRKFFDNVKEMAQVNGYTKTLFNRYRYYSFTDKDGNVNNGKKAAALRQAGNAVIQGCLDGNTRIQTKELGIVKIKDAVDTHMHVWDGNGWSEGDILYSGKKQKCIITFSNGQKFICSPIHKFLVKSAKGNTRFVECRDLATKANSKNPHRIVVNPKYHKSDFEYSSEWARKFDGIANNVSNSHLDDVYNSFDAGVVLGRLASDGTIGKRTDGGAPYILNYVAEHEMDVVKELRRCMEFLGDVKESTYSRSDRNENMHRMYVYSSSLVNEISELDIKHRVHDLLFNDTEMLRGFLRGIFDGDGGVSGKTITLTFGKQYDFTEMVADIQKALLFFGIRSRAYEFDDRYKLTIKTNDNELFMELIGFISEEKNNKANELQCINDEHLFGRILIPESVEITDEYIDMYDVCNTDNGYYVADGIVTHNTAADIFKIGVARNFSFIRKYHLFGKLLIINMIHDEQLMEVDVQHLNMQRILAEVGKNMQFKIEGFPPLYIGAGIGKAWGYAKGKMAEIHPTLLEELTKEAANIPIYRTPEEIAAKPVVDTDEVLAYFDNRVYEFRRKKVADYLSNPENWHKDLHPAIGGLINLQFNYGRGDDAKSYKGPNGETYSDSEFLLLNMTDFINENGIDAKPEYFKAQEIQQDVEEDKEYDESEDGDDIEGFVDDSTDVQVFSKVDESDKVFGSSVHDLIGIFGTCVLEQQKICGIDTRNLYYKKLDAIIDYLMNFVCDEDDDGALQVVFLTNANVLNYTGIYVKNVKASEFEAKYKAFLRNDKIDVNKDAYKEGDIDNRSQAK